MDQSQDSTHFGYQTVNKADKASLVRGVFDGVADQYDVMNDLMSFGIHRLWKRFAVALSGARRGQVVLDLASGTGDLAARLAGLVGSDGLVLMSDINAAMLHNGRDRMLDKGHASNICYVQIDAEQLPLADNSLDVITMGFGLRNVTDKERALASMYRALKPGGRVLILEFSTPTNPFLQKCYDLYSFHALPKIGKLVVNDADSYRYLAESIRMHPDQGTLKDMMQQVGFERCDVHNLSAGIVAIHRGFKL